jgi:hypothetical protein
MRVAALLAVAFRSAKPAAFRSSVDHLVGVTLSRPQTNLGRLDAPVPELLLRFPRIRRVSLVGAGFVP